MEADIVEQAGRSGHVTIATNMAGRGTDIVLGGSLQADLAALDEPTEENIAAAKLHGRSATMPFWQQAACILSVLSAMNPAVSITSYAVVQAVRVMPVLPASTCLWKMR